MDSSIQTQIKPLGDRSTNTHLPPVVQVQPDAKQVVEKPTTTTTTTTATTSTSSTTTQHYSMDYHRKALQEKLKNGSDQYVLLQEQRAQRSNNASYVSPSDDIMSPCTKKLSDLKGKRFKNAKKPSSLFTKLGKKTFEQSSSSSSSSSAAGTTLKNSE